MLLTKPSLGRMLVRWTTSRCADCDTRESDESEMMWSQIPDKVLHYKEKQVSVIPHIKLKLLAKKFLFWELTENKQKILLLSIVKTTGMWKARGLREWKILINVRKMYMQTQFFWSKDFIVHWEHLYMWTTHFSTCSIKPPDNSILSVTTFHFKYNGSRVKYVKEMPYTPT